MKLFPILVVFLVAILRFPSLDIFPLPDYHAPYCYTEEILAALVAGAGVGKVEIE